jgi:hypothetical protein
LLNLASSSPTQSFHGSPCTNHHVFPTEIFVPPGTRLTNSEL